MKPITIVGGGLAGLTLGIGLRRRGVPVTLWEAGGYPRHRVCGECMSGRGLETLRRLDLLEPLRAAGARPAVNAAFFSGRRGTGPLPLPQAALCVSRFTLDDLLAREFRKLGGELREHERWGGDFETEGTVRATGRRVCSQTGDWRWFGLKAHARQVDLGADLELHLGSNGYVGLCRLGDGRVNACGLFRTRTPVADLSQRWREWLRGPDGSPLRQRLQDAEFETESFCCVAGLPIETGWSGGGGECALGDALSMIPPFTGNGMSLALESAETAVGPVLDYAQRGVDWRQVRHRMADHSALMFKGRLRRACWLQQALLHPLTRDALVLLVPRCQRLWRNLFALAR